MADERQGFFDNMSSDAKGWVCTVIGLAFVISTAVICLTVYMGLKVVYLPETFAEPQTPHTAKATIKFE